VLLVAYLDDERVWTGMDEAKYRSAFGDSADLSARSGLSRLFDDRDGES
jgi:hypothetical protein